MSTTLVWVQRRLHDTFGDNALVWFDRSYALDWAVATACWALAWWIKELPPYERDFSTNDVVISHSHRKNQISGTTNMMIALVVPAVTVAVVGTLRVSAMIIHHGLLSLWTGSGFSLLITEFLKNRVGRLRPDFLSRCKWDKAAKACTGELEKVTDGRRSFPSGHSSEAWAGMTFLSLFLAGVTGAWCLNRVATGSSVRNSRMARICLTLAPIAFATWVAVSRIEDYRHHIEDVLVGSLIGLSASTTCYMIYWPNPFTLTQADLDRGSARPRSLYADSEAMPRTGNGYSYELAGMEHEHATETV